MDIKHILDKYLNGSAEVDEQAKVKKLLSAEGENHDVKEYIKNDWDQYMNRDEHIDKDMSGVLSRIHYTIDLEKSKSKYNVTRKIYRWYSAVAAILIIPLLIVGAFTVFELDHANQLLAEKSSTVKIISPNGGRLNFQLPDGSEGVLNGGSSIEYTVPFIKHRNLKLIGEAYFDVEHDESYPFNVSTKQCDVKVLGTKFNVNAYPDEKQTEVILEEGKVTCLLAANTDKIMLNPNERIIITGEKAEKHAVNAKKFTAWRKGKLIFRGDSMAELARRISRWYNVDVEIEDDELTTYSFRATFEDDPLEEVLYMLKMTSPINYKIEQRELLSDGSFTKKKVILFLRN